MGGDAVLLHDLEEVLGDLQADLALAFHAAAHGVEAGVEVTVLAGAESLKKRVTTPVASSSRTVLVFPSYRVFIVCCPPYQLSVSR